VHWVVSEGYGHLALFGLRSGLAQDEVGVVLFIGDLLRISLPD